jgi:chromosome segregation ATPase
MTADAQAENRSVLREIDSALEPMRRKQRDLQTFMASQLERLELLAGRLDERERELLERTEALTKERAALEEEWGHLDSLVETAQSNALEIRQEKQRLEQAVREHHDGPQAREIRRLRDEVEQLSQERRIVECELETAQRKIGQLADVAVELSETRAELAAAHAEIERMRREPSRIDAAGLAELQHRVTATQEERDRLAAEVRRLKQKEAEFAKLRDEDNRRYTDERLEWLNELRSLRKSFQHKPGAEQHEAQSPAAAHVSGPTPPPQQAPSDDRQLDDVLTQFEAVKRDLARHRPRKPNDKP